jgi:hypothetical protein
MNTTRFFLFFAALIAGASPALAADPYLPVDFHLCGEAREGGGVGTIESVREVPIALDLHSFDPAVLEHKLRPQTAEEVVVRLDAGAVVTLVQAEARRFAAGQRVRVILSGIARVELEPSLCYPPLASVAATGQAA